MAIIYLNNSQIILYQPVIFVNFVNCQKYLKVYIMLFETHRRFDTTTLSTSLISPAMALRVSI